jgi:hypothetical protein
MLRNLLYSPTLTDATKDAAVLDSARILLARYALKAIGSKVVLKKAALFPKRVKRAVLALKREVVDSNEYFLSRLWRAFHTILRDYIKIPVACARYDVPEDEIFLAFDVLGGNDFTAIARSSLKIERMGKKDRKMILKAVTAYSNTLLNRKIGSPKFIAINDPGFSIDDIKKELVETGRRMFLHYEHIGSAEKVKNYAKRGMHNRCINFIKHSTAQCRRPISNVGDSNREFALTKVSIDADVGKDRSSSKWEQGDTEQLGDITKDPRMVRPDTLLEQKRLITRLKKTVPPDIYKFVKIVVGNKLSSNFVRWMSLRHGVAMGGSDDLYKLGELAMEYLGVDRSDVIRHVIPHLQA